MNSDPPPLESRNFFRDALKLISASGAAAVIRALVAPVIARFFSPAALGIAQTYSALGKTAAVIATLRYEDSIQLPQEDRDAHRQVMATILLAVLNGLIALLFVLAFRRPISTLLNAPQLENLLFTAPIFIILRGSYLALREWHIRGKRYRKAAFASAAESAVWGLSAVGFGLANLNSSAALIGAQLIGQAASCGLLVTPTLPALKQEKITFQEIIQGIREYKKFPLFNIWSKILDNAALYLPVFLFSSFFSPAAAGQFTMGFNLLQLPFSMIANAAGQVLYQQAPQANRQQYLTHLLSSLLPVVIKAALPPVILFAFFGREMVTILFGVRWLEAGTFVQFLSPWMLFILLSILVERIPAVFGKNENVLIFHAANFCVRAASLVIGGMRQDALLAVVLLSVSGCLVYTVNIISVTRTAGLPFKMTISILGRSLLNSLPVVAGMALVSILLPLSMENRPIALLISSALVCALYYGVLFLWDSEFRALIPGILRRPKAG